MKIIQEHSGDRSFKYNQEDNVQIEEKVKASGFETSVVFSFSSSDSIELVER